MRAVEVYLAGPEVFLPDAIEIGTQKKKLCHDFGFIGLYPYDYEVGQVASDTSKSRLIFQNNVSLMRKADFIVANLTPFRGPSADVGTVFEVAMMMGMGKSILGYSNVTGDFLTQVRQFDHLACFDSAKAIWRDCQGMTIEDFGHADNLMISESLAKGGFPLIQRDVPSEDRFRDLTAFSDCLAMALNNISKLSRRGDDVVPVPNRPDRL